MAQLSLSHAQPFSVKKAKNPSRNKLAQTYTFTLVVPGATNPIVDEATWQDKGQGRDWYEAKRSPMGLKMYKHSPQYTSNETEWKLWSQHDVVRANTPRLYGQFVVNAQEHNCDELVQVNVLVQDRVGPSLANLLAELCTHASSWNHPTALQVVKHWRKTFTLADELSECCSLGWANDFHTGNICLSLCGGRMVWCDWEVAGADLGPVGNMKLALKKLRASLTHILGLSDSWKVFHEHLFRTLKESLTMASAQTYLGCWRLIVDEVLTEYGPPPILTNNLISAEADVLSLDVGASGVILPANPLPHDNPSETSNETRWQNKRTAQHFVSDPVDYNHCRPSLQKDDAVLIHWSQFDSRLRANRSNLADDDGIVGQVVSATACACAGRNLILRKVSWIIWGKFCSLWCAVGFVVLAIGFL